MKCRLGDDASAADGYFRFRSGGTLEELEYQYIKHILGSRKASYADLARLLGYTPSTLRTWLNPAHPRAPSDEALSRLRQAVISELTDKIRGLGLDVIPRRNSVGERNGNIFDNAA